jgi:hypothetical protein
LYDAGRIHARLAIRGHTESVDKAFGHLQQASQLDNSGILADVIMIKLASILGLEVKEAWYATILEKLAVSVNSDDLTALAVLVKCQPDICTTPPSTIEAIYRTAFHNANLRGAKRRAHAYSSYGYYLIKVRGDPVRGREYFEQAVETNPGATTHWINLLKLLVDMRDYDAAEDWLSRFRLAEVHGAGERDFRRFERAIEKGRRGDIAEARLADRDTGKGN